MSAMDSAAPAVLSAPRRRSVVVPVLAALAVLVPSLAVTSVVLHLRDGGTELTSWWYGGLALAVTLLVPAVLIAARRPENPVGWLMCLACLCEALCSAGREYLVAGVLHRALPGWLWVGWFCDSLYIVAIAALPTMLMLFPDGRPLSRRTRPLLALPIVGLALGWFGYLFTGDVTNIHGHRLANPAAGILPETLTRVCAQAGQLLILVALLGAAGLLVLRLRRSTGAERQRVKWVVWAGAIVLVEVVTEFVPGNAIAPFTSTAADALLVAAIAVAILRHGLFDIDVVINRTLVFAALSVLVVGGYIATVVGISALLGETPRIGPGLLATALVAVLFAPARSRLQRGVDRLMYGERRNPYRVMTQLGRRLERDDRGDELTVVVDTVTQALKLPYAAIFGPHGERLAEVGMSAGAAVSRPLTYQGQPMGHLVVELRDGTDRLDRESEELLADLARQIGAAVHAVRLSGDLQESRRRLVNAKEEERRRLRRDLHDGLGPKLAALGLKLGAVAALADTRPERSKQVLADVQDDIRTTIDDVRRLVYGLRPPALDELGLVGALRECGARFTTPAVIVTARDELPALPAAVEVAAYWITNEALTNVVRHAHATRCTIELSFDGALQIAVRDDGSGLPPGWRPGVGTSSMRERAAELGGAVTVGAGPDGRGTEVRAVIPT